MNHDDPIRCWGDVVKCILGGAACATIVYALLALSMLVYGF